MHKWITIKNCNIWEKKIIKDVQETQTVEVLTEASVELESTYFKQWVCKEWRIKKGKNEVEKLW